MNSQSPYIAVCFLRKKNLRRVFNNLSKHHLGQLQNKEKKKKVKKIIFLFSRNAIEDYMCLPKVANQRGSDHERYIRFQADNQDHVYGGDEQPETSEYSQELNQPSSADQYQNQYVNLEAGVPPTMFSGYSRPTEMSAMVSALTHVVSGQRSGYASGLSGAVSSSFGQALYSPSGSGSGSGSWSGQKRGREEDATGTSHQLLESSSSSRAFRGLAHDFRTTQQLDSSPTTATGQFDFIE